MAQPSAYEQYLLELINRGRLDPAAEAQRFANDLNEGLTPGTISTVAKQPLAFNLDLIDAARGHSQWMLDSDVFSHTGAGGSNPGNRMTDAGYVFSGSWTWGENIAWAGTTGTPDVTAYVAMEHENLFLSEHHRENTMNGDFQEVGLGVLQGTFTSGGTGYNAVMTTENFAKSGAQRFLTGVAFTDADADGFYTPGEGRAGVTFFAQNGGSTYSTDTMFAGGYQQAVGAGTYTVTISGGGIPNPVAAQVAVGAENVKLDLVGYAAVQSSASLTMKTNLRDLTLLGAADLDGTGNFLSNVITGNSGANLLHGAGGNDTIYGGAGADILNGGSWNDVLDGGQGRDKLLGSGGNDTLVGGAGGDWLYGNAGNDVFVCTALAESSKNGGPDRIFDFVCGSDKIDVAAANLAAGLTSRTLASASNMNDVWSGLGTAAANAMVKLDVAGGSMAGTYLYINDAYAVKSAGADAILILTGISGTLALSDFV